MTQSIISLMQSPGREIHKYTRAELMMIRDSNFLVDKQFCCYCKPNSKRKTNRSNRAGKKVKSRKAMNCGGICKKPTLDSLDKCILYHTIYYSICLLYFSFYYILLLNAQKLLDRKIKLPILHKTKQLQQSKNNSL